MKPAERRAASRNNRLRDGKRQKAAGLAWEGCDQGPCGELATSLMLLTGASAMAAMAGTIS